MQAGRLKHVFEIQDFTLTQDGNGDDVRTYFVFATVHAEIRTLKGSELFAAQQQFATATSEVLMRYRSGVVERMRGYHRADDTFYNILNVNDVKRLHKEMILTCESGVSDEK